MALSFAAPPALSHGLTQGLGEGRPATAAAAPAQQHVAQLALPATVAAAVLVRRSQPWRRLRAHRVARAAAAAPALVPAELASEERKKIQALLKKWRADDEEAWQSLALTMLLYVSSLAMVHLSAGSWPAVVLLAFSLVRSFIVFHDAAHSSFFEKAEDNKLLAQVLQFFVNYSLDEWNQIHNSHHSHFGDNTVKDNSLTIWFSEEELAEGPGWKYWAHRIIRDPIFFYPLAGLFVFFLNKPLQHGPYRTILPLLVYLCLGSQTFVAYLLASWLGGSVGVAFFHLQHHCNSPYRCEDESTRTHVDAAMLGSTRIPLFWPLSVFSFGIEYHHIHHLDIRVPGYRLPRCDAEGEALGLWKRANTVDGLRAVKSLCHTQFRGSSKAADESGQQPQFVSFWPYSIIGLQDT